MVDQNVADVPCLREEIRAVVAASGSARVVHRLYCLFMLACGIDAGEVAQKTGVSRRSLQRWVKQFARHGAAGLDERPRGGRPSSLAAAVDAQVRRILNFAPRHLGYRAPRWNGKLLAQYLCERHAVKLSVRQCQRYLRAVREA
ncbi:MAG: helix-turn-helix domain containing protein [Rhodocyclaceae bacterium]|nr:helix-turn-helix domain containing protein [Rhodocyclaceae bacterium]MBX3669369.1 helix-turn-helix domain containing protein [Rhodocyclaceae bacterium]